MHFFLAKMHTSIYWLVVCFYLNYCIYWIIKLFLSLRTTGRPCGKHPGC